MDGDPKLTKNLYDKIMISCQEETKKDLALYKYGNDSTIIKNRWLSMTISKGSHKHLGAEKVYHIKKGTPVIWTRGLADKTEVIVNSKYLTQ